MPQRKVIPENPELHSEIMVAVAEGKTNIEIAKWLSKKLNRTVNRHHVQVVVAERRAEREVATRAVLEEQAGKTAVADLEYIGRMLGDAHEVQCAAMPAGVRKSKWKFGVALKAIEVQRKLVEMRYKLLGIGDLDKNGESMRGGVIVLPAERNS